MTDDAPHIDLEVARRFIAALTGSADAPVCWQTFDDLDSRKDQSLASHRTMPLRVIDRWLVEQNGRGCGIYLVVNETDGGGREIANVMALRAAFIDVDGTRPLPDGWPLAPSIVVQRGPQHWHAYWLLQPGEPLEAFTPLQVQLAGHWLSDTKVADLPRVMRVPGFLHRKADPLAVHMLTAEASRRYTVAQVLAAHPVDWAKTPEIYQRKAERIGLWKKPAPAVAPRPAPARSSPQQDDAEWQRDMFIKWAGMKETGEGSANPNGGRDAAAFAIACEGHGRGIDRGVIEDVVLDYLQRANFPDAPQNMKRIVGSACSQPRQAHAPVRRAPPAGSPAPGSATRPSTSPPRPPSPPKPPAPGGAGDGPGKDPASEAFGGLNRDLLARTWLIDGRGVCPVEFDARAEGFKPRPNKRVASLPIWPEQAGRDVATARTWWKLAWTTPAGETRRQWIAEEAMKVGIALVGLPDAPVAKRTCESAAQWLTEARSAVTAPAVEVVSRIGWCGINGARRWVWPGLGADAAVQFVGEALPSHGRLEGWKAGLEHVAELGRPGYIAVAVAALSAASPFSRLLNGQRNPVLGLQAGSSKGKGSVIDWALALWCESSALRLPASSTGKGVQDRAIQLPDLPIFLDELQQLVEQDPRVASDALYFLANGQRRVTSSKTQTSVGGESRHGVGFYAAEAPVLPGLNLGVHMRVVELTDAPCPDEATARILRAAGQHSGVLAAQIAALIQAKPVGEWTENLRTRAAALKAEFTALQAGDSDVLALLELGCVILERTCQMELPIPDLLVWLAGHIGGQRAAQVDREALCLQQVLAVVLNLPWVQVAETPSGAATIERKRSISLQQRPVAWRDWSADITEHLDVDPLHPALAPLFAAYGGEQRVLRAWADRGWIERGEGKNLKLRRHNAGRVVRFAAEVLKREAVDAGAGVADGF